MVGKILLILTVSLPTASGIAASFTALGFLQPSDTTSQAYAVSQDGTWVGGRSDSGFSQAFRWSVAGGMQELGLLPGQSSSSVFGISDDGQVLTGSSGSRPFIWSRAQGMVDIGLLPGMSCGDGWGISGDGDRKSVV